MFVRSAVLISILASPVIGFAQTQEVRTPRTTHVVCRSKNTIRTVRVQDKGTACRTIYTKDGEERVVATARSLAMCEDTSNKIRKNLEENYWRCKEISESRVSSNY